MFLHSLVINELSDLWGFRIIILYHYVCVSYEEENFRIFNCKYYDTYSGRIVYVHAICQEVTCYGAVNECGLPPRRKTMVSLSNIYAHVHTGSCLSICCQHYWFLYYFRLLNKTHPSTTFNIVNRLFKFFKTLKTFWNLYRVLFSSFESLKSWEIV